MVANRSLLFSGRNTKIQPGHDKIIDHLVSILLIECIRDHIQQMSDQQNWLGALTHPELSNALSAIHSQPEISWTVESLAEQCCMSRSKFANLLIVLLVNHLLLIYSIIASA